MSMVEAETTPLAVTAPAARPTGNRFRSLPVRGNRPFGAHVPGFGRVPVSCFGIACSCQPVIFGIVTRRYMLDRA